MDHAVAYEPLPGELESGDLHLVRDCDAGTLIAVVDGLGHGGEAAYAARRAVDVLAASTNTSPVELFQECHVALTGTRGVVMTLALVAPERELVSWLGVGNVEARLIRNRREARPWNLSPPLLGGVLGHHLPQLRESSVAIRRGDLLIMATDGISSAFSDDLVTAIPVGEIAERILKEHSKGTDDALVLVARYLGLRHG